MSEIKTLKQAKKRISKLECIISWLAQNPIIEEIESMYDEEEGDHEEEN
jgi:hypothetical protein